MKTFKNPEELLKWMSTNINYGWMDSNYKEYHEFEEVWWENYSLLLPDEVYKHKIGTCFDQSIFEYHVFQKYFPHLNPSLYFVAQFKDGEEATSHMFLSYKENRKLKWFENSWMDFRGIHGDFETLKDLIYKVCHNLQEQNNDAKNFWVKSVNAEDFTTKLSGKEFYEAVGYPHNRK